MLYGLFVFYCLSIFSLVFTLYNWTIICHFIVTGDCPFFRSLASSKSFGMSMLDLVVPHTHTHVCCTAIVFRLASHCYKNYPGIRHGEPAELFSNTGTAVSSRFFCWALYISMLETCHVFVSHSTVTTVSYPVILPGLLFRNLRNVASIIHQARVLPVHCTPIRSSGG